MKQRQSLVTLGPGNQPSRVVEVLDVPSDATFLDWLGGLGWPALELLARCTAHQAGSGHEIAFTIYDDDDGDAADDPFDGVRIVAHYRDSASRVVSREEYDRIVADVCAIAIGHPPAPLPEWWPSFLENARIILGRADE